MNPQILAYGLRDRILGCAVTAFTVLLLVVGPAETGIRVALVFVFLVLAWGTLESFTRRVELFDDYFVARSSVGRLRKVEYIAVRRIEFFRDARLRIHLDSGDCISFPARIPEIDKFIELLAVRVAEVRSVEIIGDLEFVKNAKAHNLRADETTCLEVDTRNRERL